jgi:protein-disulfide isomerase
LSPDQKVLSPELYDVDVNHKEQDRRQSAEVRARLEEMPGPALGSKAGAVTLLIFSDFQCPFCKQAAEVLRSIAASDKGGQMRVEFRHHPLGSHSWARTASRLAACAGMENIETFWEVHDFLFAQQDSLSSDNVLDKVSAFLTSGRKVDMSVFQQCVRSTQPDEVLLRDENIAAGLKVTATPTIFINGSKQVGVPNADSLRVLVDQYARSAETGDSRLGVR